MITGPAIVCIALFGVIVLLSCILEISNARERADRASFEELESKYEMAQMQIKDLQREARAGKPLLS